MQYCRCLGFDYGLGSTGVAVGDIATKTVQAVGVIKMSRGIPDWSAIDLLLKEWSPDVLLVGKPLTTTGKQQNLTTKAKLFVKALTVNYALPVFEVDERYSTVEARSNIYSVSGRRGLTKKNIDAASAVIICEQWLNNFYG